MEECGILNWILIYLNRAIPGFAGRHPLRGNVINLSEGLPLAFPLRGIERPENSPVDCF